MNEVQGEEHHKWELRHEWKLTMAYGDEKAPMPNPSAWDEDECEVVRAHPRSNGMSAPAAVQVLLEQHAAMHTVHVDEHFVVHVALNNEAWMTFHRIAVIGFKALERECCACGGQGVLYWDDDKRERCDTCEGTGRIKR